ncbi:MAG: hypothetical protein ABIS36_24315 [Chryseolinea sp.]
MKTIVFILLIVVTNCSLAATLAILPANSDKCPLVENTYSATGYTGCYYNWVITNGVFTSGNGAPSIKVKWNDDATVGTLKVTTSNCQNPDESGASSTNYYNILSLYLKSFGTTNPSTINVDLCNTGNITITVDPMTVTGTNPARPVDKYYWQIPTGWQSVPNVGSSVVTTTNSVVIKSIS